MSTTYGRRLLVSVDAKGYGTADDQRQHAMQTGLLGVLEQAARRAGLDRSRWDRQPAGDSELAVLPADAQGVEPILVDDFARELNTALDAYNRLLRDEVRLRLRLAVHFGVVAKDENGFSGQGPVVVSRLVDSEPAKQALVQLPDANLVVVLSHTVFTDAVVQGHTSLSPHRFRPMRVTKKEFDDDAYLYLPGCDIGELELTETPAEPVSPAPAPRRSGTVPSDSSPRHATVTTTINGAVKIPNGTIGVAWNQ